MDKEFGVEILSDRETNPEDIVEALHEENMRQARQRGLEPRKDSKHVAFGVPGDNFANYCRGDGFHNFEEYLDAVTGVKEAEVSLYAENSDGVRRDIAQPVKVDINAPDTEFCRVYGLMDSLFEADFAALYYMGDGNSPAEAYQDAELCLSIGRTRGNSVWTGVAVREDELEINNVNTDAPEDTIMAYEALQEAGVYHDAAIARGDEGEDEWIVANSGTIDTRGFN